MFAFLNQPSIAQMCVAEPEPEVVEIVERQVLNGRRQVRTKVPYSYQTLAKALEPAYENAARALASTTQERYEITRGPSTTPNLYDTPRCASNGWGIT